MTAIHAVDHRADDALESVLRAPLPDALTDGCSPGDDLLFNLFLRPHLHGLHPFLVETNLNAAVDVIDILPEGTAVCALFDSWREWASAHVVSDSERLLNNGDYMAEVLLDADEDDVAPWRLVVVEDAEELLRRDARAQVGSALGRLLNTADGLLGQGSKALILLTTNEPVGEMHPALLRPGRCLARVEFPPLSPAEAAALLGTADVSEPMTLAEVMERRGALDRVQAVAPARRPGLYL